MLSTQNEGISDGASFHIQWLGFCCEPQICWSPSLAQSRRFGLVVSSGPQERFATAGTRGGVTFQVRPDGLCVGPQFRTQNNASSREPCSSTEPSLWTCALAFKVCCGGSQKMNCKRNVVSGAEHETQTRGYNLVQGNQFGLQLCLAEVIGMRLEVVPFLLVLLPDAIQPVDTSITTGTNVCCRAAYGSTNYHHPNVSTRSFPSWRMFCKFRCTSSSCCPSEPHSFLTTVAKTKTSLWSSSLSLLSVDRSTSNEPPSSLCASEKASNIFWTRLAFRFLQSIVH